MKINAKTLLMAASVLALTGLGVFIATRTPFEQERPAVGAMAPELDLADYSGQMVNLAALRGKVVLVNFWATWCPPCVAELGWFESVYRDYRDSGLVIMAIAVDGLSVEQAGRIEASFSVGAANERVLAAYRGSRDVPVSFLVGRDGRVIRKVKRAWPEDDLRAEIEKALAE